MSRYRVIHHPYLSEEWLKFRDEGIGGSDVSTVLSWKSPELAELVYSSPIQLFAEKIGEPIQRFAGNVASEMGHLNEPFVLNMFRHYDLEICDQMDMLENIKAKRKLNDVVDPKKTYQSIKYFWLFGSPDGFLRKKGQKRRVLEVKCTTSMETKRYENKINPSFIFQVQQNLLILGLEVSYVILYIDGKWVEVVPVEANKEIQEHIIEITREFWIKVLKAREIKINYELDRYFGINPDFLTEKQKEGAALLQELEPEYIGNAGEYEFIKEMVKPTPEYTEMIGTEEQLLDCEAYHLVNEKIKHLEKVKTILSERLIMQLGGFHKAWFNMEDKIFYSFKPTTKGSPRLYVSPKTTDSWKNTFFSPMTEQYP